MTDPKFKLEHGASLKDATGAAGLASQIAEVLAGNNTQTVLNALVLLQAEFIARQPADTQATLMKLIADAIEANVPFLAETLAEAKEHTAS